MKPFFLPYWFFSGCEADYGPETSINGPLWMDQIKDTSTWVNLDGAPRNESFQALDLSLKYSYGSPVPRVYDASPMAPLVKEIMESLNVDLERAYNVCVLNYYANEKNHLGWRADDSPEQDPKHPIAVISFGAPRYLYIKEQGFKGEVPEENKFLLKNGSLFEMPAGFQETHFHKIPKHDKPCGPRVSLTYRKLDR